MLAADRFGCTEPLMAKYVEQYHGTKTVAEQRDLRGGVVCPELAYDLIALADDAVNDDCMQHKMQRSVHALLHRDVQRTTQLSALWRCFGDM
jgi:hypothetical protein